MLEILESSAGGSAVLHLTGRVNGANAAELCDRLCGRLRHEDGRPVLVDLSRLAHITSAGFRSLLLADRLSEQSGRKMVLYGLNGLTLELFEISGFVKVFTIAESREEAVGRAMAG